MRTALGVVAFAVERSVGCHHFLTWKRCKQKHTKRCAGCAHKRLKAATIQHQRDWNAIVAEGHRPAVVVLGGWPYAIDLSVASISNWGLLTHQFSSPQRVAKRFGRGFVTLRLGRFGLCCLGCLLNVLGSNVPELGRRCTVSCWAQRLCFKSGAKLMEVYCKSVCNKYGTMRRL